MELTDILICPRTGSRIHFGDGDSVVRVHGSDVTYPVVDGIVDFCPDVKDTISKAYDAFSSRYDAYMTSGKSAVGMFVRMFDRLVWGFSDESGLTDGLLSHLPSGFDGVLLDVPRRLRRLSARLRKWYLRAQRELSKLRPRLRFMLRQRQLRSVLRRDLLELRERLRRLPGQMRRRNVRSQG